MADPWVPTEPVHFEVFAEIRPSDALRAALAQFIRRAPRLARAYLALFAMTLLSAILLGGSAWFGWALVAVVGIATIAVLAWVSRLGLRARGGRPVRLLYHFCDSGFEVRLEGRSDWVAWDDLWDVGETGSSFLLSPSADTQYIVPKRACPDRVAQIRGLLEAVAAGRRMGT